MTAASMFGLDHLRRSRARTAPKATALGTRRRIDDIEPAPHPQRSVLEWLPIRFPKGSPRRLVSGLSWRYLSPVTQISLALSSGPSRLSRYRRTVLLPVPRALCWAALDRPLPRQSFFGENHERAQQTSPASYGYRVSLDAGGTGDCGRFAAPARSSGLQASSILNGSNCQVMPPVLYQ